MKKRSAYYPKFFAAFLALAILMAPFFAFAAGLVPCGEEGNPCQLCHLFGLANNVVGFIWFSLAMPLSVLALLAGGFFLVTAGGNPSQIEKGKKFITWAIIGLVVTFSAWIIVDTLLKALSVGDEGWRGGFGPWNEFSFCREALTQ